MVSFAERDPVVLTLHAHVIADVPERLVLPRIMEGQKHRAEFVLHSFSGTRLTIESLQYDQDIVGVRYSPGPEGNFKFTLEVVGFNGGGPFSTPLIIYTNDSVNPIKRVDISGYVVKLIEAEPTRVAFGVITGREEKREKVRLYSPYGEPIIIDRIEIHPPDTVEAEVLKTPRHPSEILMDVRLKAPSKMLNGDPIYADICVYGRSRGSAVRTDVRVSALRVDSLQAPFTRSPDGPESGAGGK